MNVYYVILVIRANIVSTAISIAISFSHAFILSITHLLQLMQVVSDEENSDVISWLPHGKGFIIYKKKKFASDVLPKYFKNSKYTSFTRKLNRWGFTRVTRGPETGAYYHKYFQRGDTRLCMQMSCQSNKHSTGQQMGYQQFGGKGMGFPGDLQNQHLIRQQLQQLQLHQFHLQQMQVQQQMQAAEMFRQQQANTKTGEGGEENKDDNKSDNKSAEGAVPAPAVLPMGMDPSYFQQLQAGVAPMGMLPVLQAGSFQGVAGPMGAMPPAPGTVVAPPAANAAPTEESKAEDSAPSATAI